MLQLNSEETEVVLRSRLFSRVPAERLEEMLVCLQARRRDYSPGEYVHREGGQIDDVGLVLSGHALSLRSRKDAQPLLISVLARGSFLGILLAASRERRSPVDVVAQEELSVLFFPADRLMTPCEKRCPEHIELFRSFLDSVAEQSLTMNDRISCLLQPTVREKALSYLRMVASEKGVPAGERFSVPLDRNAMARYLNVERSALSRELSRMKDDGLIECRKNLFRFPEN